MRRIYDEHSPARKRDLCAPSSGRDVEVMLFLFPLRALKIAPKVFIMMSNARFLLFRLITIAFAAALLSACATGRYAAPPAEAKVAVRADKALVVFMRVSSFGYAISSSVFELKATGEALIGIPGPDEMVVHYAEPGKRRFMVIAESADFLEADLEAGKAYYAAITPRFGAWKARFSLHPFKQNPVEAEFTLDGAQHKKWLAGCKLIGTAQSAGEWAAKNAQNVHAKRVKYEAKWREKSPEELRVRTLEPGDGLAAAIP